MLIHYSHQVGIAAVFSAACLSFLAIPARAADVLGHVPDTALAVVVVNNVEKGSDKIDQLAKKLRLPPPSVLNLITGEANIEKGLNRQGTVAAAMFAPPEGQSNPRGVVLIPTTDYKALIGQLEPGKEDGGKTPVVLQDKEMVATKIGEYAALAEPRDGKLLDELRAGKTSIAGRLGEMSKWLEAQDAYALATSGGISLATDKILEAMEQVQEQFEGLDENQAEMIKMAFGIYRDMFSAAKSELAFAAAGVRGEDKGVHLTGRLAFKSGSRAAKYAASVKPLGQDLLAGLPDGKLVAAGGIEFSGDLIEELYSWSGRMVKSVPGGKDLKEEDLDALMKLSAASMEGCKSASFAMYAMNKDEPIYSSIVGLMRVDNSAKFTANYEKSIAAMNELAKKTKHPFLQEGTVAKTQIEGKPALELTMAMPETASPDDPIAGEILKKFFGDAKSIKGYVVAIDDKTVAIGYVKPDAVKRAMKATGAKGLGGNANIAKAAELLPDGCQLQSYLSPKGLIDMVIAVMPGVEFSPVPALLGDFPDTPPIGFGAKLSASGLETDLVVPEETLEAIGGVIARTRAVSTGPRALVHKNVAEVESARR